MYLGTLLFLFYFGTVFIYLLSFFSNAADNEHSYLVEIPVERSIFELRFVDI